MNKQKLQSCLPLVRRLARQHGAVRLRVFGSVARGDTTDHSDLDLLADFEPGRDLLDVAGLKVDLESALGCKVDIVEEAGLSPYIKGDVLKEAQPL